MSVSLRILLLVFSIVLAFVTTVVVKRGRMPIKYSLLWYFSSLIIFILYNRMGSKVVRFYYII